MLKYNDIYNMKTLLERLHINKNTTSSFPDDVDTLTCCDELYQLLDTFWNDHNVIPDPREREDYFNELINGDRKRYVDDLLNRLVYDERLSKEDADKYSNNIIILDFCTEIADLLRKEKFIDVNKIYQEIAR